jgi:signal transduction histidine kinase
MHSTEEDVAGDELAQDRSGPRQSIRPFGHAEDGSAQVHASLLAMLTRDLRAPIATVIMGLSEVSEALREPDPTAARLIQLIRHHAERAMATADDAADLGAIACGALRCDRAALDLTDTVKRGVSWVIRENMITGVTISIDSALGPVCIVGDRTRLERVIAGLVADAARRAQRFVRIRFRIRGRSAQLEIIDDGPDSDVREIEALLGARHSAPAPDLPWGLAARLAIARDVIAAHQGTLGVSRPNRRRHARGGARISIQLPVPKLDGTDTDI